MYCFNCGAEIKQADHYCRKCHALNFCSPITQKGLLKLLQDMKDDQLQSSKDFFMITLPTTELTLMRNKNSHLDNHPPQCYILYQ